MAAKSANTTDSPIIMVNILFLLYPTAFKTPSSLVLSTTDFSMVTITTILPISRLRGETAQKAALMASSLLFILSLPVFQ